METKLKKLHTFKQITLTDTERASLRAHGAHVISAMAPIVTESLFHRGVQHGLRIALSTFLFIVFVGSSVSVIANSALPGDALYSFKVNVNEEVKGLFLKTSEEKVVWQKNRIESRVNEIKTLAETKTLTAAKQETAKKALDNHVKALSKELTTLSSHAPNTALTVTASLEESLKTNKTAIENAPADSGRSIGKEAALQTVTGALEKVSEEEVKIISKEIENISTEINTVPQTNSASVMTNTGSSVKAQESTMLPSPTLSTPVAP